MNHFITKKIFKKIAENIYKMFMTYVMSDKQLDEHSFPKWMQQESTNMTSNNGKKKEAMLPNFQPSKTTPTHNIDSYKKPQICEINTSLVKAENYSDEVLTKQCRRCNKTFQLMARDLSYVSSRNSECVHHWGKLRNVRVDKSIVPKYFCCNGGANETGCEVSKHVNDGEYDGHGTGMNLSGYVETSHSGSDKK